ELAAVERLRPWLVRVLYRMFVDGHRKRARSRVRPIQELADGEDGDPCDQVASEGPGPEEATGARYTQARLQTALGQLSDDHRSVVALHDMEGYTLTELETLLEVPTGTLKSRLHRARARLRELLERDGTL
ncbi:MAG TPA: sigma-70 family RNA polymerase sigma factor, partial [Gammaproteobacteria bacterium]|nr:sigma-70 family RNA polymerase sigma factor [Gammaproteobacteria bacterium]